MEEKKGIHNIKVTIPWIQPSWFKLFFCGLNGHKMTNYPKFAKMHEMFQGENASNSNGKVVVDVKIITTQVNIVDINVATKSIIT